MIIFTAIKEHLLPIHTLHPSAASVSKVKRKSVCTLTETFLLTTLHQSVNHRYPLTARARVTTTAIRGVPERAHSINGGSPDYRRNPRTPGQAERPSPSRERIRAIGDTTSHSITRISRGGKRHGRGEMGGGGADLGVDLEVRVARRLLRVVRWRRDPWHLVSRVASELPALVWVRRSAKLRKRRNDDTETANAAASEWATRVFPVCVVTAASARSAAGGPLPDLTLSGNDRHVGPRYRLDFIVLFWRPALSL